ncbi:MAG: maleate cis-trans isomerase family protein [Paracoccus sp. (in: a-proteobacteria)]|uniref:maleate cis-trans isomerase family protein n=1 Tax=Paracoccus sp. TaxID=267 RepID=UPI002E87488B|nr:aspartate/glutamate racemase family protein [Pseudomonadota bacterium]
MRHASVYSHRGKIGLVTPATNTVNEAEWTRLMPDGVTFHAQRMVLRGGSHSEAEVLDQIADAGEVLARADVDVIAYACTAGSMVTPAGGLEQAASARAGRPVVTTAAAIVAALGALGATRVAIATPYHEALNDHERDFLSGHGIRTLAIRGLGIGAGGPAEYPQIARTPLDRVRALALEVHDPDAEALLLTCTDFPTLPLIPELEAELGIPVVSSNTVTLWAALRAAGINDRINDAGRLLTLTSARKD